MTFPHVLCLDHVLHNMALISVSNYSSLLSLSLWLTERETAARQLLFCGKDLGDTCLR